MEGSDARSRHLVSRLTDEQKRRGILGCTTGNHGQSLAYACRLFGVRCMLVVPEKNNPDKIAAMRALGAELIEHGRDFDAARLHCDAIHQREGLRYVHSANEPDLIAGVGTYGLEIFDELPEPDVVIVPVGLGSHVHWDRKLDALLAQALMSIQAVKAVEIGDGWENAAR